MQGRFVFTSREPVMTARRLAIIGGTGLTSISDLKITGKQEVDTPFGACSSALTIAELAGDEIVFLPRHGHAHNIPPHKVNYRANIWALYSTGITHVIGVGAVGGISRNSPPEKIMISDQIVDYTYDRKQTFFEQDLDRVTHVDFVEPYCHELREIMLRAAAEIGLEVLDSGTYGVTQGPRLETAAEVKRMGKDGCDVVGMTAMPEAALARELNLCYATCAFCANWAAGAGSGKNEINMAEIQKTVEQGMVSVRQLLVASVSHFKLIT